MSLTRSTRHSLFILDFSFDYSFLLIWFLGQISGYFLASNILVGALSFMRYPDFGRVCFIWLFIVSILPFIFVFISFLPNMHWMLSGVVFLKGLFFAFSFCCVGSIFNDAAWMGRWLCFFSSSLCTVLFLWFLFSCSNSSTKKQCNNLWTCVITVFFVACFDYMFILPLFIKLLD